MNRNQKWAGLALERVEAQKKKNHEAEYRTICLKGPALLKQAGVVQALAFWRSRSGEASTLYLNHLAQIHSGVTGAQLFEQARKADTSSYLVLSHDLIKIAEWLRRFAQSELREEQS